MEETNRNCTEKLIFCIDLSNEIDSLDFKTTTTTAAATTTTTTIPSIKKSTSGGSGSGGGGNTATRLDLLKGSLRVFVATKQKMNPNHEFGIIVLTDTAIWYQDLTGDIEVFSKKLMGLQSQGDYHTFNLSSLFTTLTTKFPDILKTSETRATTEYIYRVIFIYARSNTIPHLKEGSREFIQQVLNSPIFYFDGLYLHSKPTKDNKPQDVYDFITDLEGKDHTSYFYENSTSVRRLHLHITHLLAHPFQRPDQSHNITSLVKDQH